MLLLFIPFNITIFFPKECKTNIELLRILLYRANYFSFPFPLLYTAPPPPKKNINKKTVKDARDGSNLTFQEIMNLNFFYSHRYIYSNSLHLPLKQSVLSSRWFSDSAIHMVSISKKFQNKKPVSEPSLNFHFHNSPSLMQKCDIYFSQLSDCFKPHVYKMMNLVFLPFPSGV